MTRRGGRRRFLRKAGRFGIAVAAGAAGLAGARGLRRGYGGAVAAPQGQFPIRPPGAIEEASFRAACTKCFLCGEICPVRCIRFPERIDGAQPPLLRAPGAMARDEMPSPSWHGDETPLILPWINACVLCMKCGPVCPTGALRPILDDRETIRREVRMGTAIIDEKICLPWNRRSWCGACLTACPYRGKAITVDYQGRPTVHAEACVGCGLCVEVCPIRYKAIAVRPRFEPERGAVRAE